MAIRPPIFNSLPMLYHFFEFFFGFKLLLYVSLWGAAAQRFSFIEILNKVVLGPCKARPRITRQIRSRYLLTCITKVLHTLQQ